MPSRRYLVAALLLALLALPAAAFGHASFEHAEPAEGSRLERSPAEITVHFSEALNRSLTSAELTRDGEAVPAAVEIGAQSITVRPRDELAAGGYRVEWRNVSSEDGDPDRGSISLGVQAAAPLPAYDDLSEKGPSRADRVLEAVLYAAIFYGPLFLFAGGVLGAAAFGGRVGDWLLPADARGRLATGSRPPDERARRITLAAGVVATVGAAVVALVEADDAAGGLGGDVLSDYFLSNTTGSARLAVVVAVAAAVVAFRWPRVAALMCAAAFAAVAVGGHANAASPKPLALLTMWVHLSAAAIWIGGIGQIAGGWLPAMRAAPRELRRLVMRSVLARFGVLALPAFAIVAATGVLNSIFQLSSVSALWDTNYGRVLAIKVALVGVIALASYVHAMRLRPRLLAADGDAEEPGRAERRHWQLLGSEPVLAGAVLLATALLIGLPPPTGH